MNKRIAYLSYNAQFVLCNDKKETKLILLY
jgi:hypothetical protein